MFASVKNFASQNILRSRNTLNIPAYAGDTVLPATFAGELSTSLNMYDIV
jgi:hypothetical protein